MKSIKALTGLALTASIVGDSLWHGGTRLGVGRVDGVRSGWSVAVDCMCDEGRRQWGKCIAK